MLKPSLIAKTNPKANENQIFKGYGIRITYITPRLIRVEKENNCTDLASFAVWNRNFKSGMLNVTKQGKKIIAETEDCIFTIKNQKPYSVYFKDTKNAQIFSKQKNLKGTRRTLDGIKGTAKLENGLITENGAYVLDDSRSMLLNEKGNFEARAHGSADFYAFAYGKKIGRAHV